MHDDKKLNYNLKERISFGVKKKDDGIRFSDITLFISYSTQPLAVITLFNSLHSFSKHDWHVMNIRTMRKAMTQFSWC